VAFDSQKESLSIKIDKLREAIDGNNPEEVNTYAYQVFTDALAMTGDKSPMEMAVKAVYDVILQKQVKDQEIPGIVSSDKNFNKLREDIGSICEFMLALANGDLSQRLATKGYLAGVLKMFQSHLRNLTWQTQMVSRGDFTQRVHFMGEFAKSFNLMVEQLDQARKAQAESEEKYRLLAITDPLTGLPNRRHFFDVATAEFTRARRYEKPLSIIMTDIDHFKKINDNHGHQIGDLVIQLVAERLKKALRETDVSGRYGGEEFVALLPETSVRDAQAVAERVRESIENIGIDADGSLINITSSFGVSEYDGANYKHQTIEEVIDDADKALYKAKNDGRNRVVVFNGSTTMKS
jgi:diguanylate cyclase (GGDEF)-like protein